MDSLGKAGSSSSLDLKTVCNELSGVKHKIHQIGIQLGISHGKMKEFKNEDDPLSAAIDDWLHGNTNFPTTWEYLVECLNSKQVGESGLASIIYKKYCFKEEEDIQHKDGDDDSLASADSLDEDVKINLRQQLELRFRKIQKQYAAYVDQILTIVISKNISAKQLRTFLINLRGCPTDEDKEKFKHYFDDLQKEEEITSIFELLSMRYASFLDYDIFQSILEKFGDDVDQSQEDLNYPFHLKEYIESHKISEFMRLNPSLVNSKLERLGDSSKVNIKLNIKTTQNLSTLMEVTKAVSNILGIPAASLRLCDVKKGCVLVTFCVPTSITDAIFSCEKIFTKEQIDKFRAASVLWMECKGQEFDFKVDPSSGSGSVTTFDDVPFSNSEIQNEPYYKYSLNEIKKRYDLYLQCICTSLEERNTNVHENLFEYLKMKANLNLQQPNLQQPFLGIALSYLKDYYASFLDHHILDDIVIKFGIFDYQSEANREILRYPELLKHCAEKHKVFELVKVVPELCKYTSGHEKITIKFEESLSELSLANFMDLKSSIAKILKTSLRLTHVDTDCWAATYLMPSQEAHSVFLSDAKFTDQQTESFQKLSIVYVECCSRRVYFTQGEERVVDIMIEEPPQYVLDMNDELYVDMNDQSEYASEYAKVSIHEYHPYQFESQGHEETHLLDQYADCSTGQLIDRKSLWDNSRKDNLHPVHSNMQERPKFLRKLCCVIC